MVDRSTLASSQTAYSNALAAQSSGNNQFPNSLIFAVPGYNYVGNGANDAWNKWNAYIVTYHPGDPLLSPSNGQADIDRMDALMAEYRGLVANADGTFTDYEHLLPTGLVDAAAYVHDQNLPVESIEFGIAGSIAVNNNFAVAATVGGIESGDPLGVVFGAIIEGLANADAIVNEGVTILGDFIHAVAVDLGLAHDDTATAESTAEGSTDNGGIVQSEYFAFSDSSEVQTETRAASEDTSVPGIADDWEEYDGPLPPGQGPPVPPAVDSID